MPEHTTRDTWIEGEDPLENLASDLWGVQKALSAMSDEEQLALWEQAVAVLHDFGKLAQTLHNDPLLLAVTDAKVRSEEELERAHDRLNRPEGGEVSLAEAERERLSGMVRRCDGLNTARWIVEEATIPNTVDKANALSVLKEAHREASEALARYRREVGS
jgi:hypothetical protein